MGTEWTTENWRLHWGTAAGGHGKMEETERAGIPVAVVGRLLEAGQGEWLVTAGERAFTVDEITKLF